MMIARTALALIGLAVTPTAAAAAPAGRDLDRDGLSKRTEQRAHCNPRRSDTDRDGMPDGYELRFRLNCRSARDAARDPDFDRLSNLQELRLGTNPRRPDSDGDGTLDGADDCPVGCEEAPAPAPAPGDRPEPQPPAGEPGPQPAEPPVTRGIDLAAAMSVDKDAVESGEQLVYTIEVRNDGDVDAPGVEVAGELPITSIEPDEFGNPRPAHRDVFALAPPVTSQGACGAVDPATNRFSCAPGTIGPGQAVTIQVTVRAACPNDSNGRSIPINTVESTARATTAGTDTDALNNISTQLVTITNTCR
jgi:hypothetical protein